MDNVYHLDLNAKNVQGAKITLLPGDPFRFQVIAGGRVYLVRYCDVFIIGCTNKEAAQKVWRDLGVRLKKFGLERSEAKSRLIEFGMKAYYKNDNERGKLKTFDFLGFKHYMGKSRGGRGISLIGKSSMKCLKDTTCRNPVL